jgi:polynucleotide 5'-hydroxyl-kinase GRC3/NOL9
VPPAWERITIDLLGGVTLVIGAPDTGKTTFARYLCRRLGERHERVAFVDGDMGQAALGPPTTMTLVMAFASMLATDRQALSEPGDPTHSPPITFRVFVGAVSPRRHMLPTVVGAGRLVAKARSEGATAIVFDTTGLVDPVCGGGALKRSLIDLVRPAAVVGIQRENELEHLLLPLRRSGRTRVIDLPAPRAARRRYTPERRAYRTAQFRRYFSEARRLEVAWDRLAVFPAPAFAQHQLVALEDREGFTLALGIVLGTEPARRTITLHTPLPSLMGVNALSLGDLALDPGTFDETDPSGS